MVTENLTEPEMKIIDYILDSFDFDKVLKTMHFLDWKWRGQVVTLDQIKGGAIALMIDICERKTDYLATGGFIVLRDFDSDNNTERLELIFAVDHWDHSTSGE